MSTLRESRYNIRVPLLGDRALLFNSLSRGLCLLDADEVGMLDRVATSRDETQGHLARELLGQGFLVHPHTDELAIVKRRYEEQRGDSGAVTLTVCPTLACNFGCDYCFQGADKSVQKMSPLVQDGIIDLYRRILHQVPRLHTLRAMWYGGEPLLKPDIILSLSQKLIDINVQKGINYSAAMISNASKLDRKMATSLYAKGLRSVQITLDGARPDHDARRQYLSGKGSYERILANVKSWVHDVPISIDLRVNVDERNKGGVHALIDDLADNGLSHLPNLRMYFAPVESVTKGCHAIADQMIGKIRYGRLEAELTRYAFERGLAELPYPPSFMGLCSALKPYDFIVVPNGDVHKCWDTVSFPDKKIGSILAIEELFARPSSAQTEWDQFSPFDNAECRACKIVPNCTSFCAHKFINKDHTLGEAALPCPSLKYSINEKIILRAEKEGFITKEDYDAEAIRTRPQDLCSEAHVTGLWPSVAPTVGLPAHV